MSNKETGYETHPFWDVLDRAIRFGYGDLEGADAVLAVLSEVAGIYIVKDGEAVIDGQRGRLVSSREAMSDPDAVSALFFVRATGQRR